MPTSQYEGDERGVDLWDDVTALVDGRRRFGTVASMQESMLLIRWFDGEPDTWLDRRGVSAL